MRGSRTLSWSGSVALRGTKISGGCPGREEVCGVGGVLRGSEVVEEVRGAEEVGNYVKELMGYGIWGEA